VDGEAKEGRSKEVKSSRGATIMCTAEPALGATQFKIIHLSTNGIFMEMRPIIQTFNVKDGKRGI